MIGSSKNSLTASVLGLVLAFGLAACTRQTIDADSGRDQQDPARGLSLTSTQSLRVMLVTRLLGVDTKATAEDADHVKYAKKLAESPMAALLLCNGTEEFPGEAVADSFAVYSAVGKLVVTPEGIVAGPDPINQKKFTPLPCRVVGAHLLSPLVMRSLIKKVTVDSSKVTAQEYSATQLLYLSMRGPDRGDGNIWSLFLQSYEDMLARQIGQGSVDPNSRVSSLLAWDGDFNPCSKQPARLKLPAEIAKLRTINFQCVHSSKGSSELRFEPVNPDALAIMASDVYEKVWRTIYKASQRSPSSETALIRILLKTDWKSVPDTLESKVAKFLDGKSPNVPWTSLFSAQVYQQIGSGQLALAGSQATTSQAVTLKALTSTLPSVVGMFRNILKAGGANKVTAASTGASGGAARPASSGSQAPAVNRASAASTAPRPSGRAAMTDGKTVRGPTPDSVPVACGLASSAATSTPKSATPRDREAVVSSTLKQANPQGAQNLPKLEARQNPVVAPAQVNPEAVAPEDLGGSQESPVSLPADESFTPEANPAAPEIVDLGAPAEETMGGVAPGDPEPYDSYSDYLGSGGEPSTNADWGDYSASSDNGGGWDDYYSKDTGTGWDNTSEVGGGGGGVGEGSSEPW